MSFFKIYQPSAELGKIIRAYQVYHIHWDGAKNLPDRFITCLANTEQNIYFILRDPMSVVPAVNVEIPQPPVIMTGPKYKPVGLLFGKNHLMIKVCFHPTGTFRLTGIDLKQTVNNGLDASKIWGDDLHTILKQLRETASYDTMIEIVSDFFEKKFLQSCRPEEPIDHVAIEMLNPHTNYSIAEWAHRACLSLRQFERNFIIRTGISPKLFLRIVRFENAMRVKNSDLSKTWSDVAIDCGYTDSSHLLKEFKLFAEFPPSKFYLQQTSGYSELSTG